MARQIVWKDPRYAETWDLLQAARGEKDALGEFPAAERGTASFEVVEHPLTGKLYTALDRAGESDAFKAAWARALVSTETLLEHLYETYPFPENLTWTERDAEFCWKYRLRGEHALTLQEVFEIVWPSILPVVLLRYVALNETVLLDLKSSPGLLKLAERYALPALAETGASPA